MTDYREFYYRHLPHWQPKDATLFVTTRLAGSLPQEVIVALKEEHEREMKALLKTNAPEERNRQAYRDERRAFDRWDAALDCSDTGPHWLGQTQIAEVVAEALHYRDGRIYDLLVFCIMPNHLHIVLTPFRQADGTCYPLHRIMQSFKRHTARKSNEILARRGAFWQEESYDHVIRNTEELQRISHYTINNPVKAGLVFNWEDWPWTYCRSNWLSDLLGMK